MITRATIVHVVPTILTFAVLMAVAWWGHRTGWSLSHEKHGKTEAAGEHEGHWCAEHGVPEAECLLCRKSFAQVMKAKEPKAQVEKGEEIRFSQISSLQVLKTSNITTAPVVETTMEPTFAVPAETIFDATRVTRVMTRMPGIVRQVGKRLGDAVAVGEVLAVVESAEIGRLKSDLMRALAEQAAARATAERIRASAEGGFRTAGEAREAQARLQAAQIAVFDAEQGLLNLGFTVSAADLAELEAPLLAARLRTLGLPADVGGTSANLLPIIATQAGTVTDMNVVSGEAVESGKLLVVVADTSRLWLSLAVTPAQATQVKAGQIVRFIAGDIEAVGSVTQVAPAADDATRLVPVHAVIDNGDGRLRAHQVGNATVVLGQAKAAVMLPRSAFQYDGPTAYVFIQRTPTIFRGLPVQILGTTPDGLAVSRVLPGDVIAISGTEVLKGNLFQEKFGPGCCAPE
jgi:cobalt-zinc-cadmium efflux system membrane fusion protein